MQIDEKLIRHVAELARIKLTDKEVEKFTPQLNEVLEGFRKLEEVNTDDVEPSFHPIAVKNHMREDKEEECLTQEEALSCTKHKKDGYFIGPKAV